MNLVHRTNDLRQVKLEALFYLLSVSHQGAASQEIENEIDVSLVEETVWTFHNEGITFDIFSLEGLFFTTTQLDMGEIHRLDISHLDGNQSLV